jgi:flagellar basal-body rod protein FlgB
MEEISSVVVAAKALDGLSLRMTAIAQNLANVSSPQFRSARVDFETALRNATGKGLDAVRSLHFTFVADEAYGLGDDRRIDLQIADASTTASKYAALADMIGRRLAIQHALVGGK